MARCGCASDNCNCNFLAGNNVAISGVGSRSNPYVIEFIPPPSDGGTTGGGTGTVESGWSPGDIKMSGRDTPETGWLLCDGSNISRGQFPDLFAAIGTKYGPGDGVSTFRLPPGNDRVPMGAGSSHPLGSTGGSDSVTLTTAHLPQHSHSMAHQHTINHDHGETETDGSHNHDYNSSTADGPQRAQLRTGDNAGAATQVVNTGILTGSSNHHHTVVPYNGNSGVSSATNTGNAGSAAPQSLSVEPKHFAVNYFIKI